LDFWDTRGYTSEGYQWLSAALHQAPDAPTYQRCRALFGAGIFCGRLSQNKNASKYFEDALNLARQLNIEPLIIRSLGFSGDNLDDRIEARKRQEECIALARTTRNQAYLAEALGYSAIAYSNNVPEAGRFIEEALAIADKLGNARLHASILWEYGGIEMRKANHESAISLIQKSLHLSQLLKDKHSTAHCLLMLGRIDTRQANFDTAIQYEEESLQTFRDLSDQTCYINCLFHIGWNAYLAGKTGRAIECFNESLSIIREIDPSDLITMPTFALGRIAVLRGDLYQAKVFFLEALDAFKKFPDSLYYMAYCLEAIGAIPSLPPDKAARLLGKAEAIREQKGYVLPIVERHLVDPIIARLQSQLGKEAFDSARIEGKALTIEQVIDDAIEVLQIIE
jgi:tetratricopeptide (TPR) repeat protein